MEIIAVCIPATTLIFDFLSKQINIPIGKEPMRVKKNMAQVRNMPTAIVDNMVEKLIHLPQIHSLFENAKDDTGPKSDVVITIQ